MADPGFPTVGRQPQRWGINLLFWLCFSLKLHGLERRIGLGRFPKVLHLITSTGIVFLDMSKENFLWNLQHFWQNKIKTNVVLLNWKKSPYTKSMLPLSRQKNLWKTSLGSSNPSESLGIWKFTSFEYNNAISNTCSGEMLQWMFCLGAASCITLRVFSSSCSLRVRKSY